MTPAEKIAAIRRRRAALKASGKRLPRRTRPPRQLYPHGLEREYAAALLRLIAPALEAIKGALTQALPAVITERDLTLTSDAADRVRTDASYGRLIGETFDGIRLNVARKITAAAATDTAQTAAGKLNAFNAAQVDRQFSAVLGIPVLRQERWLEDKLAAFATGNVSLINDIPDKAIADLQSALMARVEAGDSQRSIATMIQEKLEVTRRRAEFIARDQVAKLNGKLTELRQREVGVEEYIWRAVTDGATRASHLRNNGKTFRWDDPPDTGHPGEDFQCRCTAEPVLKEFVEPAVEVAA